MRAHDFAHLLCMKILIEIACARKSFFRPRESSVMPLLSNYQKFILDSIKRHDFQRILRFRGKCHDALIGEWINWWLGQNINGMICNPARGSKLASRRCFADILFLEQFKGEEHYEVKGVAEVENNKNKFIKKIKSLTSYEEYTKRGSVAYPDLEFAIFCYTLATPNDALAQKVYSKILKVSQRSDLLWIVCEIGKCLSDKETVNYSIHMPNYVKGYNYFFYNRNFDSVILYFIKKAKQIGKIMVPEPIQA